MYRELSDYDKRNTFDVESFLKRELKMGRKEVFELYEADGEPEAEEDDGKEEETA